MLVSDPPFIGSTAQAIVAKVLTEKPAPPSKFRETVPEAVEDAVLTALAKLPADRWPSASAFIEALKGHSEVTRSRVTSASMAPPVGTTTKWSVRSPLPWMIAFGLAVAVAVAAWLSRGSAEAPAVLRFELQATHGTHFAFPIAGVATEIALSPDGRQAVYAASTVGSSWMLYLTRFDQLGARVLPGTDGAFHPEFSPDGRWVAFWSGDGFLRKIAIDGSGLTTLCRADNIGANGAGLTWLSDREIVFGSGTYTQGSGLWRVSSDGGKAVPFAQLDSATGERLQLAPRSADHGRLVFYSSTIASNADLTMAVAETKTGRVTVFRELPGARAVALVDGHLVYVRGDGALMAAPFDTRSLRVGKPLQIADSIAVPSSAWGVPVSLSANGSLLYQRGGIASQLVSVAQQGATRVLLDSVQVNLHPRLSPDGRRIAVEVQGAAGADIWITDLAGRTTVRLTNGGYNNRPEWAPDGSGVLYTSSRAPANGLWSQPADGSAGATLLFHTSEPIREGIYTPDGKAVVYRIDSPGNARDIYLVPLGVDQKPVPLVATTSDEKEPRVSPDNRFLAYVSNESGREEVYLRGMSSAGGRVTVSTDGGGEPLWSSDGRRLFYRIGAKLIAATIVTSPSLAVTGRETLFEGQFATDLYHPNYDVSRDGQSFVMVRPVEQNRQLVMVVNWIQELRQRIGGKQ